MNARTQLFEAVRPLLPAPGFAKPGAIEALNRFADLFAMPAVEEGLSPSKAALDLIKRFEGCKLTAYPDPGSGGDPWTIGYGATGAGIRKGVTWTQAQADQRLADDVERFATGVAALLIDTATTQGQFDALVSLAFNVGLGALGGSTLLRKHKAGDIAAARAEFARWNRAGGRVLPGLSRRRAAEAALYGQMA